MSHTQSTELTATHTHTHRRTHRVIHFYPFTLSTLTASSFLIRSTTRSSLSSSCSPTRYAYYCQLLSILFPLLSTMSSRLAASLYSTLCLLLLSLSPSLFQLSGASSPSTFDYDSHSQPQSLIDYINGDSSITWNATINPIFYERPYSFVQSLCGTQGLTHPTEANSSYVGERLVNVAVRRYEGKEADEEVPVEYDARKAKGATCPSLWDVRNQGNCGSCCKTTTTHTCAPCYLCILEHTSHVTLPVLYVASQGRSVLRRL